MVLSLLEDLGFATTDLLPSGERSPDALLYLERMCRLCQCAQRVLAAPKGSLQRSWRADLEPWLVSPDRK